MSDTEVQTTLGTVERIHDWAERMEFDKFHNTITKILGCDKIYSRRCHEQFQRNPVAYLSTRRPMTQSEALLRTMN